MSDQNNQPSQPSPNNPSPQTPSPHNPSPNNPSPIGNAPQTSPSPASLQSPQAENPDHLTNLHTGKVKTAAAGLPAVISSFRHILEEPGLVRGLKALSKLNQKGGFDCPSCAWPDPDDERSGIAEYCENGAKAVAEEATTKKIDAAFFADKNNDLNALAALTDHEIGKKGRIAQPMYLSPGATHYQPIAWDDAFKLIAKHLNALASPDQAIFYTSGRTSNEAAWLYQLFVRAYGTNNLPDCSNMCHESSGSALTESLGLGKGSVTLEDIHEAECIIIMGQNPGTNHPRMLTALQKAKANGATIISVNPLPETGLMGFMNPQQVKGMLGAGTPLTDLFLQVKLNGDLALLKGIELLLWLEEERNAGTVFDQDFIQKNTEGYEAFLENLQQQSLTDLSQASGISIQQMSEAAAILKSKSKIIICWAMGLTQHKNAVDTIKEAVNLLLLRGSIGKPGAGTCPVRGHSNVQGDRTVGIWEKPTPQLLEAIEKHCGFVPPKEHGLDTVNSIKAMHEGKAKVFFAMGGNFLSATSDTLYTAEALRQCNLTVHVSTKLNRSHLVHGNEALILPCLGRTDRDRIGDEDQFVSCENSMGVVQMSKGILKPISDHLLGEPVIIARLAKAVLGNKVPVDWDKYIRHYDTIREDIEKTIPGFDQYNKRVRQPGGFYLPNANRQGKFSTDTGKAKFNVANPEPIPLQNDELLMMTIRSHDQFNTTIYGLDDRYRGIFNERRVIFMNEKDIQKHNLQKGDTVDLFNNQGGRERIARQFIVIPYSIPESCCATYYPETNVLVPIDSVAEKSNTPVSKSVIIKIARHP